MTSHRESLAALQTLAAGQEAPRAMVTTTVSPAGGKPQVAWAPDATL